MGNSSSSPSPPPTPSEEELARIAMQAAMGGFVFGSAGGDFLAAVQGRGNIDLNVIQMDGQQAELRDKYNGLNDTYNNLSNQHNSWRNQGDQIISAFRTAGHATMVRAFTQLEHTLVLILACSDAELNGPDTRGAAGSIDDKVKAVQHIQGLVQTSALSSNAMMARKVMMRASLTPAVAALQASDIQLNANSTAVPASLAAKIQEMVAAADATQVHVAPAIRLARFAVPSQPIMARATLGMAMPMVANFAVAENQSGTGSQTPEQKRNQVFDAVDAVRAAFKDLTDVGEALHSNMCTLSQLGQNLIGFLSKEKDDVNALLQQIHDVIGTDQNSFNDRIHRFAEFNAQASDYENRIRSYDNKNFIEKWFCPNAHDQYGAIAAKTRDLATHQMFCAIQMGRLINITKLIQQYSDELARKVQETYTLTQSETDAIFEGKNRSLTLYDRLYDLQQALATRDVFLTVDNAVRHILQVVTSDTEMIYGDGASRDAKNNMLKDIQQHYGEPKATDLIQHPRYVARAGDEFGPDTPNLEAKAVELANLSLEWNGATRAEQQTSWQMKAVAGKASLLPVIKAMSFSNQHNVRIRVLAESDNSVRAETWADTHIDMLRVSCLSIDPSDPRFQTGLASFHNESNWAPDLYEDGVWMATMNIAFSKPFRGAPKVPLFLAEIDEERDVNGNNTLLTAAIWAQNVGALGFTLCAKVWGGRTKIWTLGVQWIAHDPYDTTVQSGSIRHDSGDWVSEIRGKITFDPPFPASSSGPKLLAGIAGWEMNTVQENPRFQIVESNVSRASFDYEVGTWVGSRMKHGRWSWLAISQ